MLPTRLCCLVAFAELPLACRRPPSPSPCPAPSLPLINETDIKLLLAGREPLPAECIMHPGRKVCKLPEDLLA